MDPGGAELHRRPPRGVAVDAPSDAVTRFQHRDVNPGLRELLCRARTGHARADDDGRARINPVEQSLRGVLAREVGTGDRGRELRARVLPRQRDAPADDGVGEGTSDSG